MTLSDTVKLHTDAGRSYAPFSLNLVSPLDLA